MLARISSIALFTQASMAEEAQWLSYEGGEGPGKGKHIVLISADQEYRSEQSFPMMAKILSKHHGFDCTVLFGVNADGLVDPTMPVFPKKVRRIRSSLTTSPALSTWKKPMS